MTGVFGAHAVPWVSLKLVLRLAGVVAHALPLSQPFVTPTRGVGHPRMAKSRERQPSP